MLSLLPMVSWRRGVYFAATVVVVLLVALKVLLCAFWFDEGVVFFCLDLVWFVVEGLCTILSACIMPPFNRGSEPPGGMGRG